MKTNKKEKFIEKANKIHNYKYDYSLVDYINNKTKVKIICPIHGIFEQRPNAHLFQIQGCPRCSKINNYEDFIIKASSIHNNIYNYPLFKWTNSKAKIKIFCKKHSKYFEQIINDHLNGHGCPICNKNILTNEKFYNNIYDIHNNKYDYSKLKFDIGNDIGIIICPIHGEFKQKVIEHYNGHGCSKCEGNYKLTNIIFKEKANLIHNNKYNYKLVNYINNRTKVQIICSIHGIFEQSPNKHLLGQGCPKCKESHGEKEIMKILNENNIEYKTQQKFKNCKYKQLLKFDFYLPLYNTCIEFDGEQHYKKYNFEKDYKKLNIRQIRDKIKTDYCNNNNIKLIRIKFNEIITEKLNFLIK